MSDSYDLFCIQRLGEGTQFAIDPYAQDDVTCACADYLTQSGYGTLPEQLTTQHKMQSAAELIPTTNNQR